MIRYRSRRPTMQTFCQRLRDLAGARRRFGYRRVYVLLRQEGWTVTRDREPSADPDGGDTESALVGGLHARPARHRSRLRIFNGVDDVTKECLAAVVDTSDGDGRR